MREKSYTLRDLRRRALLTGPEAARRLRVHANTVYSWETRRFVPSPATVKDLARLYEVSQKEILAALR